MTEPSASTSIAPTQTVNKDTDDLYNELFSYGDNTADTEQANDDDLKVDSEPCAPGTGPPVVRNVSEESVDIYSGILAPEFLTPKRRRKSHEIQSMYEQCLSAASALEIQNQQLLVEMTSVKEENDRLKKNISSLYQTAKAEVSRKDGEIYRLRKQVWNLQRHLNDVCPPAGAPGYPQQATACMESSMNEEHLPGWNSSGFGGVVTNGDGEGSSFQVQPVGGIKTVPIHSSDKSLCLAENASPKKRTKLQRTLDKAKEIRSKYRERDRRQSTKESSRKTAEVLRRRSDSGKSLEPGSTSRHLGGEHRRRDDKDSYTKQGSRITSKKRSRSNDSCKSRDSKRSRSDYEHPSSSRKRRSRDRHRKEDDRRQSRSTRERRRDYSDEECDYSDCLDCERDRDRRRHCSGEARSSRERRRDYDQDSHGRYRYDRKSVSPERKGSRRGRKQSPDRRGSKPKTPGKSTRIAASLVKDSPMRSDSKSRYSSSPKKAEISWSERARSRDRNCDRSVDVLKTDNENRSSRSKRDARVIDGAEKDIIRTDKCADESFVEKKSGAPDEVKMEPKTQGDSKNTAIVENSSKNEQKLVDGLVRLGQVSGTCKAVEQERHSSVINEPMSKPQAQATFKVVECKDSFVSGDKVKPDPKSISVLPERDNVRRDIKNSVTERLEKCSKSSVAESKKVIKLVTKASLKEMPGEETSPQILKGLKKKTSSKTGELVTEIPERKSSSSARVKSSKLPVQLGDKVEQDFEQKDKQGLVTKGQGQGKDERKTKKKSSIGEKGPKKVSPKKNLFKDYCSKEKVAPVIETTLDKLFGEQDEVHLVDVADVAETSALPNCENAMELPGTDSPLKSKKTGYGSISQALRFSKEEEHGKISTNSSAEPADALGKELDKTELADKRSVGDHRQNPPVSVGEAGISCTGDEEANISRMKESGRVDVDICGSIPPAQSNQRGPVDSNTFDTVGSNTFDTVSSMGVEAVATVGNTAYTVGNSSMDNLGSYSNTCDSVASNTMDTSRGNMDETQCNINDNSAFTALNTCISNGYSAVNKDQSVDRSDLTVDRTGRKLRRDSNDTSSPLNNSVTSGLNSGLSGDESDGRNGTSAMISPEKSVRRRTCSVSFEGSDGGGSDSGEERSDLEAGDDGQSGSGSGGEESEEDGAGLESEVEEEEGESDASVEEEETGDNSGCEGEEQTESEAESEVGSQSGLEGASSGGEDSDEEDAHVEEEESDCEIAECGDESCYDEEQESGDEAGSMDEELQVSEQSAAESSMEDCDAGQPQSDVNADSDQEIQESDGDEQYSEDESEQSEAESSEDEARPDQEVQESDERMQVSHEELRNKQDARGLQECVSGNEQEVSWTHKSASEQVNLSQMEMAALELEEKALVKEMQSLDQESQESRERQRLEALAHKARERSRVCETSAESKVEGQEDVDIEEGELTSESEDEAAVMNDGAERDTARDSRVASERSQSKVPGTMRGDQPRRPVHERLGLLPSGTKKRARSPELERLTPPKRTRGEERSRSRERPRAGISRHGSRHSTGRRSPRSDRGKSSEHIRSSRHDRKLSPHRVRTRSPRHMSPGSERRKPAHARGRSRDRIQSPRGRRSRTPELRSPHSGRSSSRDHSSRRHEHERHEHSYERRERISTSISRKIEPDIRDRRSSHVDRVKSGGSRVPGSGRPSRKEAKRPSRSHHHSRSPGTSRSRRRSPERRRSCSSRCSCSRSPSPSRRSPYRSRARRRSTDRHSSRSCSRSRSPARHHHTPKTSGKRQDSRGRRPSTDRRRSCTSAHSRSRSRTPARRHHTKRTSATSGDKLKSHASCVRSSDRSHSRRTEHHSSKEVNKSSSATYKTKKNPDQERSGQREPSCSKLKGRSAKDSATKSTTDISHHGKEVVTSGGDRKSVSRDESIDRIDDMDCEVTLESVGESVDTLTIQNEENCTRVKSVQRSHSTNQAVADKNDKCLVRNKISDSLENGQEKADKKAMKMKTDALKVKKAKSQVSSNSIVRKSRSETSVVHKKVKSIERTHPDSAAKTDEGLTGDQKTAASNDTLKSSAPVTKKKTIRVKKSSSCGNLKNKEAGLSGGDKMKVVENEGGKVDKTKMKKRSGSQIIKVGSSESQESLGEMSISEEVVSSGTKDCQQAATVKAKTIKLKKSCSEIVVKSPKVKQSSSSEKSKDSVKVKGSKSSEKVSSSSSKSDKLSDPKAKTAVKSYDLKESSSTEKIVESSAIVSSSSENVRVKSKVKSRKSTSLEKVVKSAELKENQSLEKQSRNTASCKPKEGAATSDQILVDSTKPKGSNSTKASTPKSDNGDAVQKSIKLKKGPSSGKVVLKSKSKESSTRSSSSQVEVQSHKTKPKKRSVEKVAGSGDKLC